MLSRSIRAVPALKKALSLNVPAVCIPSRRMDHHGPPAGYKHPTMDDLPVPCGSWQENYDNNQRKYNIHLFLGIGFFIVSIAVGKYSGALDLYISPPKRPSPKID